MRRSGAPLSDFISRCGARISNVLLGGESRDFLDFVGEETRVLEVGSERFDVGDLLLKNGRTRYAGLVMHASGEDLQRARDAYPRLSEHLFPCRHPMQLVQNSADVLVLGEPELRDVWPVKKNRNAKYVVWCAGRGLRAWREAYRFARAIRTGRLGERLRLVSVSTLSDAVGTRVLCIAEILVRKRETARHFIPAAMGVSGFLEALNRRGVRYVVLRWFEDLPELAPGEDLDMLVADEDVDVVEEVLTERTGLIPCDLYSVSGLPGTAHRKMAYYPPALAEGILERAVVHANGVRVPSPEDHFRSLAYHAVYHKGEASGLPTDIEGVETSAEPEHDYGSVLARLATALGIDVDLTLEGLDDHLASVGWRPPMDTLGKLASKSRWVARRLEALVGTGWERYRGLSVFVFRRRAVELDCHEELIERIAERGFRILDTTHLSEDRAHAVARHARGGNWSTGPWPTSGGPPAVIVAAFDPEPIEPGERDREKHPGLENARLRLKEELRDLVNERLSPAERCNVVHSADNTWGALEYLHLAVPEKVEAILAALDRPPPGA